MEAEQKRIPVLGDGGFHRRYEHASFMVHAIDGAGRILRANRRWRDCLGYENEEVLGRPWHEFLAEDSRRRVEGELLPKLREAGSAAGLSCRYLTKEGDPVDALVCVIHEQAPTVGPERFLVVQADTTAQRRVDDMVHLLARDFTGKSGRPFFETLVQHLTRSLDMAWAFIARLSPDRRSIVTVAAHGGGPWSGMAERPVAGTPAERIVEGEVRVFESGVADRFPDDPTLREMGVDGCAGITLGDRTGRPIGLLVAMDRRPIRDPEAVRSVLVMMAPRAAVELEREISDAGRIRAERSLRRTENRYRLLFESAPISIREEDFSKVKRRIDSLGLETEAEFVAFLDAHPEFVRECVDLVDVVDANQACLALHGVDEANKPRFLRDFLKNLSDHGLGLFRDVLVTVFRGETDMAFDTHVVRSDGSRHEVTARWAVVAGEEETYGRVLLTSVDVTDQRQAAAVLLESEERYRQFFQGNRAVAFLIDPDGLRIVDANQAAVDYYGYSREELTSFRITDINTLDADELNRRIREVRNGRPGPMAFRHRLASGEIRDVEVYAGPVKIADREYVYAIIHDVSERKRAERALADSGARFRALIENALDIITVVDPDGTITFQSPSVTRLLGYEAEELVGRRALDLIHEEDRAATARILARIAAAPGVIEKAEFRFRHKDGSWRRFEAIARNLVDEPAVAGIVINSRDVTERRLTEELNTRLGAIVEDSINEIYVFDSETLRFLQANKGARENLGYTLEELRELTPADIKPDYTTDRFEELLRPLREGTKDRLVIETMHRRKDGSTYDVEVRLHLSRAETPPAFFAVVRDITEEKKIERQLRQAQKMEAVGQLTGGIAHDFNNLLAVVLGNLELAREKTDDPAAMRELIELAIGAADRGAKLTHRLLAFSRRQVLAPEKVDVNALVRGMFDLLRRTLGETIEIETVTAPGLWHTRIDPGQLENALLNLAINARDAMPDGGRLTIETMNATLDDEYAAAQAEVEPGEYVMVAVMDSGEGMPPAVLERVFEPFFTTKQAGAGSGLGLSMVYGFVKQSGGHVTIYSEPGRGTAVKLYLPRSDDAGRCRAAPVGGEVPRGRGEVVLLVEDDPDVRTLAVTLLGGLGYSVLEAPDGRRALDELARAKGVNLLFTDVVLPGGMTGGRLAREARRISPGIKVLFMSGYTGSANFAETEGPDGVENFTFLQKPFRKADLARAVRAALDGPGS